MEIEGMRFQFEAVKLALAGQQEPVIYADSAECNDLADARERAKRLLVPSMIPGIDVKPYAIRVLDAAGEEKCRITQADILL